MAGDEGARRDDHVLPIFWRQAVDLAPFDRDQGLGFDRRRHRVAEGTPVDRKRAAGGYLVRIATGKNQRAAASHLLVQQADRVVFVIVGAERVGTDQLRQAIRQMCLGPADWPHLMQNNRHAKAR